MTAKRCQAYSETFDSLPAWLKCEVVIISKNKEYCATAIWDTGATTSYISKEFAKGIGLIPVSRKRVAGGTGSKIYECFLVDVGLPNQIIIPDLLVTSSDIDNLGLDFIIGMDIITLGDFCVSSYQGKTTVSFRYPSISKIDLVKSLRLFGGTEKE